MPAQHFTSGPRAMSKGYGQPWYTRPLQTDYSGIPSTAQRSHTQPPPTAIARPHGPSFSIDSNHPWYHAILKLEKVLGRPRRDSSKIDTLTGRCLRAGRNKNHILDDAVREIHHLKGIPFRGSSLESAPEVEQLLFFKSVVTKDCCIKAGLNKPEAYKPGYDDRQNAKMINAAAFFIETLPKVGTKRSVASKRRSETPPRLLTYVQVAKDDSTQKPNDTNVVAQSTNQYNLDFGNRVEQALLKMDKWASAWLAGDFGDTDVAWESSEFCLAMPDIIQEPEVVKTKRYVIPAKRGYEASSLPVRPCPRQTAEGSLSRARCPPEEADSAKRLKTTNNVTVFAPYVKREPY